MQHTAMTAGNSREAGLLDQEVGAGGHAVHEYGPHVQGRGRRTGNAQGEHRNERTAHQRVIGGFRGDNAFFRAVAEFFRVF